MTDARSGETERTEDGRETLVLVPGMMCDERLFAPQIAALSARFRIEVVIPDRAETMDGLARDLLARIEAPRFNLCGLSMGGILAMAVLAQAPDRVARLALLDTTHLADAPGRDVIRNRQIADAAAGRMMAVMREEMLPLYLGSRCARDRALEALVLSMADRLGPGTFVRQSVALRDRPERSAVLARYDGPTLILCGAEDRLCPPERHKAMAALMPEATAVVLDGVGHLSTLEAPGAVTRALEDWLARPVSGKA